MLMNRNIKLGLDLAGGVSITYGAVEDNPSEEDMKDTIYKLQKRVENYSTEASHCSKTLQNNCCISLLHRHCSL